MFKDGLIGTFVRRRWEPGPSVLRHAARGEISCFVPRLIAGLDESIDFALAKSSGLLRSAASRALVRETTR